MATRTTGARARMRDGAEVVDDGRGKHRVAPRTTGVEPRGRTRTPVVVESPPAAGRDAFMVERRPSIGMRTLRKVREDGFCHVGKTTPIELRRRYRFRFAILGARAPHDGTSNAMNFEEHAAKPLLRAAGIAIPRGRLARSAGEARAAAAELGGAVVVKAQVPAGKRGKAGGIRTAATVEAAAEAAEAILGMDIAGRRVESVLVEERAAIAAEYYAAVLNDAESKGPLVMFSSEGGMDIEEVAVAAPDRLRRTPVDIAHGLDLDSARAMIGGLGLGADETPVAETLVALYRAYRDNDGELLEVNPLARLEDGRLAALDCKFVLDDSGIGRREALARTGSPDRLTGLEARGQALGLKYIELDGNIGVLANGAGLTMTTMDVIAHHGGRPANFLEIGGEAYTKATPAVALVLDNPRVECLVVNFCGAFARTDVMTGGVLDAWEALAPSVPVFFSVHGTGSTEARTMLRERLGVTPYETMDEAIAAAVAAARATGRTSDRNVGRDVEPRADRGTDASTDRDIAEHADRRADDPTARGTDGDLAPHAGGGS